MRVLDKVSDGESAIDQSIKKYQPDVVLLDICLPVLDGLGVMEQIRESGECPDTLFVIVTSVGSAETDTVRVRTGGIFLCIETI